MKDFLAIVFWVAVVVLAYFYLPQDSDSNTVTDNAETLIAPADMPQDAQDAMYAVIFEYNKCMMQNRLEYHKQGVSAAVVAEKTLYACDTHLDDLMVILEDNHVTESLRIGMVKTIRTRGARKLMSNVMQTMAGQAMALENAQEAEAAQQAAESTAPQTVQ